jgi:hypothetical protein
MATMAHDAAREIGASGTLDDLVQLEAARQRAEATQRERVAAMKPAGCGTAHFEELDRIWAETVGPYEEAMVLLQLRLAPDGGHGALVHAGCTVSLIANHIVRRDDLATFLRLVLALRDAPDRAKAVALREIRELAARSHPTWRPRAALAIGTWGPAPLLAEIAERLDAELEVAHALPPGRARGSEDHVKVIVALHLVRRARDDRRFIDRVHGAIEASPPALAALVAAELEHVSASRSRDDILAALRRIM